MSKKLVNLVYGKTCGGQTRKAVLVAMADRANDDGSGVWVSKTRLAAEIEVTRQTIYQIVRELVEADILIDKGKRNGKRGYTIQYDMNVRALRQFPDSWAETEDYEVCEDDQPIVSSDATLSPRIVSNRRGDSVSVNSTTRPYRTIDNNKSDFGSKSEPTEARELTKLEHLTMLRAQANRLRSRDPLKAKQIDEQADDLTHEMREAEKQSQKGKG